MAVGIVSNFGHCSRSRGSKIFCYGPSLFCLFYQSKLNSWTLNCPSSTNFWLRFIKRVHRRSLLEWFEMWWFSNVWLLALKLQFLLVFKRENILQKCILHLLFWMNQSSHGLRMPNDAFFPLKSRTFGLGQTIWEDKLWGIWGIFGRTFSTHFGTASPLSMFPMFKPIFLQKTKLLYPQLQINIWDWDLNLGRKELGI